MQYYSESYGRTIHYPNQPLFVSLTEDPKTLKEKSIYLVPELLLMTGLDDDMIDNNYLKREMITKTKLDPKGIVNIIIPRKI